MFIKIRNFAINTKDIHRIPLEIYVKTEDESPEHYFGKTEEVRTAKYYITYYEGGCRFNSYFETFQEALDTLLDIAEKLNICKREELEAYLLKQKELGLESE